MIVIDNVQYYCWHSLVLSLEYVYYVIIETWKTHRFWLEINTISFFFNLVGLCNGCNGSNGCLFTLLQVKSAKSLIFNYQYFICSVDHNTINTVLYCRVNNLLEWKFLVKKKWIHTYWFSNYNLKHFILLKLSRRYSQIWLLSQILSLEFKLKFIQVVNNAICRFFDFKISEIM